MRWWRCEVQRRYEVGSKVYSSQYGAGEVIAVEGAGDGERLTIQFERAGSKQLMPAFSVLEPLEGQPPPPTASGGDTVGRVSHGAPPFPTEEVKRALRDVLREEREAPPIRMMERWRGGKMILR